MTNLNFTSSFGLRIAALLMDLIILFIFGYLSGMLFFEYYASIGIYGRVIGFIVLVLYFGIGNSEYFDGQTIGKKLTSLKVVDCGNSYLPLSKSLLRAVIFSAFLSIINLTTVVSFPISDLGTSDLVTYIVYVLPTIGIIIITYLFIFTKSHQTLHDLITNSFVLKKTNSERIEINPFWKGHFIVVILLIISTIAYYRYTKFIDIDDREVEKMLVLKNTLRDSNNYNMIRIVPAKIFNNKSDDVLNIYVSLKNKDMSYEESIIKLKELVINSNSILLKDIDKLKLELFYGYDIVISSILVQLSSKEYNLKEK